MPYLWKKMRFVMKKYFDVVRSYFKGNKERCLTLLVVLILTLLSSITLIAYSFYQNKSKSQNNMRNDSRSFYCFLDCKIR